MFPVLLGFGASSGGGSALREQNEILFRQLKQVRALPTARSTRFAGSSRNRVTWGRGIRCRKASGDPRRLRFEAEEAGHHYENARFEKICGGKYLAPLYDPATQKPEDAQVCIDQFEFPDIPCVYPVVWTKAREAAEVCWAVGERLADAHEWEGACEGDLQPPDYRFDLARGVSPNAAVERMRAQHNREFAATKRWSYGPEYKTGICATSSTKTADCNGGSWTAAVQYFPGGRFSGMPQPARCLRS